MKYRHFGSLTVGLLCAQFATAGVINIAAEATESGIGASAVYDLVANANGSINNGQSKFTPNFSTISTASGVTYQDYLAGLPVGSTLIGATLTFDGLFSLGTPVASVTTTSPAFFTPSFTAGGSQLKATISSSNASIQIGQGQQVNYNLWTLFQTDLLAGNAIHISWTERVAFNDDTSAYANDCANCSATFDVASSASFSAALAKNVLGLQYQDVALSSPQSSVPEPASFFLSGFGLMIGGAIIRKRRAHRTTK